MLISVLVCLAGVHQQNTLLIHFYVPGAGQNQLRLDGDVQRIIHADFQPEIVEGLNALPGALVGKGEVGFTGADTGNAEIMDGRGAYQPGIIFQRHNIQVVGNGDIFVFAGGGPSVAGAGVTGKADIHTPLGVALVIGADHGAGEQQGSQ